MEQLFGQGAKILRWHEALSKEMLRQSTGPTSTLKYRLSHFAVRLIVVLNIAHLYFQSCPTYFQAMRKLRFLGGADIDWFIVSSFALPLYVGFEAWWMRNAEQSKALAWDGLFAIAWFFIWWGSVLYAWTHYSTI